MYILQAAAAHTCVVGSPMDCAATVPTTSPGAAMAFMNLGRGRQHRYEVRHSCAGGHGPRMRQEHGHPARSVITVTPLTASPLRPSASARRRG